MSLLLAKKKNPARGTMAVVLATALLLLTAGTVQADQPFVLVPQTQLTADGQASGNMFAHAVSGDTVYSSFMGRSVTKVSQIGSQPVSQVLFDTADWNEASNHGSHLTMYGFDVSGDYLVFAGTSNNAIWKAHSSTGQISPVVNQQQIAHYLNLPEANANVVGCTDAASAEPLSMP